MFDPSRPSLAARLNARDTLGIAWLATGSLPVAEAATGFDAVVLDLQHGLWDRATTEAAVGVLSSRTPVLLRVADSGSACIGAALDSGAEGVIVPLVETAQQAANALSAARFPPHGIRSAGGCRPLADLGAYLSWCTSHLFVAVMIETAVGVAAADEIAAVPGIDMVFIGSGDLSLSLGTAPSDPETLAACDRVLDACAASSVPCGIFTSDPQTARLMRARGFSMVVLASDVALIHAGFVQARRIWDQPEGKDAT